MRAFCNSLNLFISALLIEYYNITIIYLMSMVKGVGNKIMGSVLCTCIQLTSPLLFLSNLISLYQQFKIGNICIAIILP